MKPESHRALMELISFGMEEISSEQAAPLLARIHECTECVGQWVLIHRTIDTLSHVGETDISNQRSQQMWLVCMEHANHKHGDSHSLQDGHLISESSHASNVHASHDGSGQKSEDESESSGAERLTKHLQELRTPLAFLVPQLGFALAGSTLLLLAHV